MSLDDYCFLHVHWPWVRPAVRAEHRAEQVVRAKCYACLFNKKTDTMQTALSIGERAVQTPYNEFG